MPNALFDPIINSEDEMLIRAHLQGRKYYASTCLRAYIIASLCFEPKLVITDTAAILNQAFRSLIDKREGPDYNMETLPVPDFAWLISEGHIEFASRDNYYGNFSDLLRDFREKKKNVDLPNEEYAEKLDAIYRDKYMHKYDIEEASKLFTFNFRDQVKKELNDINTLPERTKILRDITYVLSDKEILTYNLIKTAMKEKLNLGEENPHHQHVRRILRQSYDYNIPKLLKLDYCRSLQGMKPSRKQDWNLELDREKTLECNFECNIYGLAALPAHYLLDIWNSHEYNEFEKQLRSFRSDEIVLEEYIESLSRYLLKINDVVKNYYGAKHNDFYEKGKLSKLKIRARNYFKADSTCVVIAKTVKDIYHTANYVHDGSSFIFDIFFDKILPNVARKFDGFPEPPEEMKEAVIMKEPLNNGGLSAVENSVDE